MKKIRIQHLYILLIGIVFSSTVAVTPSVTSTVHAQADEYTLLEPLPCVEGGDVRCPQGAGSIKQKVGFKEYVQYAFNLTIALAAVAAVFMIVWGGFEYMTTDSFQGKNEGKSKVTNAIYGLVLVLCSFIILRTVDPRLVEIPATLVPQLELKYNKSALDSYMQGLSEAIDRTDANYRQLRTETAASQKKVQTLSSELNALRVNQQEAEKRGITEEEVTNYQLAIHNKEVEIAQELSAITAKTTASSLELQAQAVAKSEYKEQIIRKSADIEKLYQTALTNLKEISNPPEPKALESLNKSHDLAVNAVKARKKELGIK